MAAMTRWGGYRCPADPSHGLLRDGRDGSRHSYYCSHQDHDGRPKSHPLGPSPQTRAHFTVVEAERGSLAPEEA